MTNCESTNILQVSKYSHSHFVSPDNKGHLAAPGIDETGPAGVQNDVFSISCTEPDGWVVKRLPCVLEDCRESPKEQSDQVEDRSSVQTQEILSLSVWIHELTLSVDGQHDRSIIWMHVKEERGANQVLGEVPKERDRPNTHKTYFVAKCSILLC